MDFPEPHIHSFVVKIWLEEVASEGKHATWRGHITHVASGKRRYLKELGEIAVFVWPYLEQMGVGLGRLGRVRRWLLRRR